MLRTLRTFSDTLPAHKEKEEKRREKDEERRARQTEQRNKNKHTQDEVADGDVRRVVRGAHPSAKHVHRELVDDAARATHT